MKGNEKIIIGSVVLIAMAILFSGGIYEADSVRGGIVHKLNKFTGSIELCYNGKGCSDISVKP